MAVQTINRMPPRKKLDSSRKADRHKPARQYRVPIHLSDLLEKVAERELSTPQAMLILAVKTFLRTKGELPPLPPPNHPGVNASPN